MKVGKLFLTVSLAFGLGLSIMLSGCNNGGTAFRAPEKKLIKDQQVACDTSEDSKLQVDPVSSSKGKSVSLEKFAPKSIRADLPFDYNLKVTNLTDSTIKNVYVLDEVSSEMVFVESSMELERISDGKVRWIIGNLEPMASAMIKSKAVVKGTDSVTSCAEVFYDCPVCANIEILRTDLNLSMSAPKQVMACDRIELKYMIVNSGTAAASNITIKEKLPEGLITADGKDSFEFKLDSLGPGEHREFTKMVDPVKTGKFISKAVLSSSTIETLESNPVEINVVEPVLSLKESVPKEAPKIGKMFEYVLSNDGIVTASNTMVVAMLPEGVVFSSASENGMISESDPRLITWKLGNLEPNASKKVGMIVKSKEELTINPQAVAKANCSKAIAATRLPEFKELVSVSLNKPFVPE